MPVAQTHHLEERLAQLAATHDQVLEVALDELGQVGLQVLRRAAPIGPTGNFFASLQYLLERRAVEIGADAPHAHLVEDGRGPGKMAPPALIAALMDLPPRQAFLVARSMGRRGTTGAKIFTAVRDELDPTVQQVARRLAEALGGL